MDERIRATLRKLSAELRESAQPLGPFELGKLTLNEVPRAAEKAHLTALHVAQVLEHLARDQEDSCPDTSPS